MTSSFPACQASCELVFPLVVLTPKSLEFCLRLISRFVAGRANPIVTKITKLDTGDTVSTDPIEISDMPNTHFPKIGPSLVSEIKNTSSNFTDYITPVEVGGSIDMTGGP